MIRIVIALLFAYLCLQLFIILKNNNFNHNDNVKDAEFEDSK